jgi:hypothetical protein
MSLTLTISADSPKELLAAIRQFSALDSVVTAGDGSRAVLDIKTADSEPAAPTATRKPRGPNKATSTATLDVASTAASGVAENNAAAATFQEASAAVKAAVVAARVAAVSGEAIAKKTVQDLLLEIVRTHPDGRNQVGALCRKLGAPNLSGFDNAPNVQEIYAQLIADANVLLATPEAA